jgi:hypothetical protein
MTIGELFHKHKIYHGSLFSEETLNSDTRFDGVNDTEISTEDLVNLLNDQNTTGWWLISKELVFLKKPSKFEFPRTKSSDNRITDPRLWIENAGGTISSDIGGFDSSISENKFKKFILKPFRWWKNLELIYKLGIVGLMTLSLWMAYFIIALISSLS